MKRSRQDTVMHARATVDASETRCYRCDGLCMLVSPACHPGHGSGHDDEMANVMSRVMSMTLCLDESRSSNAAPTTQVACLQSVLCVCVQHVYVHTMSDRSSAWADMRHKKHAFGTATSTCSQKSSDMHKRMPYCTCSRNRGTQSGAANSRFTSHQQPCATQLDESPKATAMQCQCNSHRVQLTLSRVSLAVQAQSLGVK